MRKIGFVFCLLLFVILVRAQSAGMPEIFVKVEPQTPLVGELFQLTYSIEDYDAEWLSNPIFSDFQRISGPSVEFFTSIVNGKVSKRRSWTFILRADREGVFTIAGAKIRMERNTVSVPNITVTIKKGSTPSQPNAVNTDQDIFVATELSTENAFLNQQIVVNYVLYTAIGAESFDLYDQPHFDGFYAQEMQRFGTRGREVTIGKRRFIGRTLKSFALFAQKTGTLVLPTLKFAVAVPVAGASNDPFANFFGNPSRQIVLSSEAKKVVVRRLPEPIPSNFSGGVGKYLWKVSADKTEMTTDDALTLKIELRGNGDARQFSLPPFVLPEGLEAFEPKILEEETYETGEEVVHSKILEVVILPKRHGNFKVNPTLVYFAPDSNKYIHVGENNYLTINVLQGKGFPKVNQSSPDEAEKANDTSTITHWLRPDSWFNSKIFWGLLCLPFLWILGRRLWLILQKQEGSQFGKNISPRPKTLSEKLRIAQTFLKKQDPENFYAAIEKTLMDHFLDRFGWTTVEFSQQKVLNALEESGATANFKEMLQIVFHSCEMARYAGNVDAQKMEQVFIYTQKILAAELDYSQTNPK